MTLRVNGSKAGREECRTRLAGEGIATEPTVVSPSGLVAGKRFNVQASGAYKEGWYEVQDEGSQLISLIADPRPGSIILDACAGAGGKSLHLADLLRGNGTIFAVDAGKSRLDELDLRARRAGVANIHAVTTAHPLPAVFSADLVLVDAPCTGVGTIRRNPWIKWRVTETSATNYAGKQRNLLDANVRFVKEGGVMMYATCSLLREENENVVASFLTSHPEFRIMPVEPHVCRPSMVTPEGIVKILPYDADTDGFFAAKLVREA
jgi:16S rRNA (cytosine967-C5)-methyltransferase